MQAAQWDNNDAICFNHNDVQRESQSQDKEYPTKLYQEHPRQRCTYTVRKSYSKTDSLESYNHAAKKECCLLLDNKRRATHEIELHHLSELSIPSLVSFWKKLKRYLKRIGIVAYSIKEITRDNWKKPTNRMHTHFLIDGQWSKSQLESTFKDCCLASGLTEKEFEIKYRELYNFYGKIFYATKFNRPEKVILFAKNTDLQKFETIGDWFLDEDGKPISATAAWAKFCEKQAKRAKAQQERTNEGNNEIRNS